MAPKRKRKDDPEKPPVDKHAPKKPPSTFFRFHADRRPAITAALTAKLARKPNPSEYAQAAAKAWKNTDQETKAAWEKTQETLKETYEKAMKKYKRTDQYAQHLAALEEFKARRKQGAQVQMSLEQGAQVQMSLEQGAQLQMSLDSFSDEALTDELLRRLKAGKAAEDQLRAMQIAQATGAQRANSTEGADEHEAFEKTAGFRQWFNEKGRKKAAKKLGDADTDAIEQEAIKRWQGFPESTQESWEAAAAAA